MEPGAGVKLQGHTEASAQAKLGGALPTAAGLGVRSRGSGTWEES